MLSFWGDVCVRERGAHGGGVGEEGEVDESEFKHGQLGVSLAVT
jgi:hypothetical protein